MSDGEHDNVLFQILAQLNGASLRLNCIESQIAESNGHKSPSIGGDFGKDDLKEDTSLVSIVRHILVAPKVGEED